MLSHFFFLLSLLTMLVGGSELLGEERLRDLDAILKPHLTLKGILFFPCRFIRAILHKDSLTQAAFFWSYAVVILSLALDNSTIAYIGNAFLKLLVAFTQPYNWIQMTMITPLIETHNAAGYVAALIVWLCCATVFTLCMCYGLILAGATSGVVLLYPMLVALAVGKDLKTRFSLSGSYVKVGCFVLAFLLAVASRVFK